MQEIVRKIKMKQAAGLLLMLKLKTLDPFSAEVEEADEELAILAYDIGILQDCVESGGTVPPPHTYMFCRWDMNRGWFNPYKRGGRA